ncbi:MAG TPA: hypothetical protein VG889_12645 [Rhizomicrobium sp.]|nr:hypothetical protein [Rhizomicrobium sp.]
MAAKKKTAKKKTPAKKKARRSGKLEGEGSYTATRNFDKAQQSFVKKNRGRIGKLGKDAEAALEGPEGKSLRAAEKKARAKARR